MATIPVLSRRIVADPTSRVSTGGADTAANGVDNLGAGIRELGTGLQRAQSAEETAANRGAEMYRQAVERKQTEDAQAWVASSLSNDHVQWSQWLDEAKKSAPPGAPNFAGGFLAEFDKGTDPALQQAPNDTAKRFYGERRNALRASLFEHAMAYEAQAGIRYRDAQWEQSIDNAARVAAKDPEQGKIAAAELTAVLQSAPNQELAQAKAAKLRDSVSKAATQGLIERDPMQALRLLDGYFGRSTPEPAQAGNEFATLSAKLEGMRFDDTRMSILRAEANDPKLSDSARAAVRREIDRIEKQAARAPLQMPSPTPPEVPGGKPQSGAWYVDQLDPQTAWTLRSSAQAASNRIMTQQNAALADRERVAEAQVRSVADMLKNGFQPSADVLDATRGLAAGTRFAPALDDALQQFTVTSAFRTMSDGERQAVLDQMRAQGNANQWTPTQAALYESLQAIDGKLTAAYKTDPLRAAMSQGVYPALAPVDVRTPQGLVQSLPGRMPQAAAASNKAREPVSPLTPEEAQGFVAMLAPMQPREQSTVLAQVAQVAGPAAAHALALQVDKHDKALALALASSDAMTTGAETGPFPTPPRYVSEMILKGARAQKDGTSTKGNKTPELEVAKWKAEITRDLTGVVASREAQDNIRDAAVYIAHAIASEQDGTLSTKDMERAVRLAVGGDVADFNGRRIVLPPEMKIDDFEARLKKVQAADFAGQVKDNKVIAAGVQMELQEFIRTLPGQQMQSYRPGQYAVIVGDRQVRTTDGRPVIVKVQ